MAKEKEPIPDSPNEEDLSGDTPIVQNNDSSEIERLFDEESEKTSEEMNSQSTSTESNRKFSEQLDIIFSELKNCKEQISRMAQETEEFKVAEQIITNLSDRNKELSEQFHEREIMFPIALCLIGMADNCREQIDNFQKIRAKYANCKNTSALKAITFLIDTRETNLTELEDVLANMAVESYRHHEDIFEPSLQKCISRIECKEENMVYHIACRQRPGYKRHERIIRKECVNVYVLKNEIDNSNNGGT